MFHEVCKLQICVIRLPITFLGGNSETTSPHRKECYVSLSIVIAVIVVHRNGRQDVTGLSCSFGLVGLFGPTERPIKPQQVAVTSVPPPTQGCRHLQVLAKYYPGPGFLVLGWHGKLVGLRLIKKGHTFEVFYMINWVLKHTQQVLKHNQPQW